MLDGLWATNNVSKRSVEGGTKWKLGKLIIHDFAFL